MMITDFEESLNSDLKINSIFFVIRTITVYSILITAYVIITLYSIHNLDRHSFALTITGLDIIWVVLNSTLFNLLLSNIIFVYLENKRLKPIPSLIKSLVYIIVYLVAFIIIYKYVLLLDLMSLLASMGVLAMVIGFALQTNISNIFSGLALNIEKTIEIGDWVRFSGYDEGKITNINWRTTTILCRDGRIIHIPNSVVADNPLVNYSKSKQLLQLLVVDVNIKYEPNIVKPILLNSLQNVPHILDVPLPEVGIKEIDKWGVKYKIIYYIDIYDQRFNIAQSIWTNIWNNLQTNGIEPSIEKEEIIFSELSTIALDKSVSKDLQLN